MTTTNSIGPTDSNRHSPDSLIAGLTPDGVGSFCEALDAISPSPDPAAAFGSLAQACLRTFADECVLELVEDGSEPYRLAWPQPSLRAVPDLTEDPETENIERADHGSAAGASGPTGGPASAITKELLHSGHNTLLAGTMMAAAVIGGDAPGYLGALVCTRRTQAYSPGEARLLAALVQQCVRSIGEERRHRAQLRELSAKVENLEKALESNRDIGMAIGILTATTDCSADQGFVLLRDASQQTNRKLRDIAADVVRHGDLPDQPSSLPH